MKIKREVFQVVPATHAPDGARLEPEERPARRIMQTAVPLEWGGQTITRDMPGTIVQDNLTAGEVAESFRSRCSICRHFNRQRWLEYYHDLRVSLGDKRKQEELNEYRLLIDDAAELSPEFYARHSKDADEIDQENALRDLGICDALTESWSAHKKEFDAQVVFPEGCCPDGTPGPNGELQFYFQPRDTAYERAGNAGYDAAMRAAQGRAPKVKPG